MCGAAQGPRAAEEAFDSIGPQVGVGPSLLVERSLRAVLVMSPHREARPLPIWTRRIHSEQGELLAETALQCARRNATVDAETCMACRFCFGTYVEAGKASILCVHHNAVAASEERKLEVGIMPTRADRTPVSALMTTDVVCVAAGLSLAELMGLLVERRFSGVPVVDREGRPVGMISKSDLLRSSYEALQGKAPPTKVGEVMAPLALTIKHNAPISQAAALMAYEGVHRIPIVSDDGRVVGILSTIDVVRWLAYHDGYSVDGSVWRER